MLHIPKTKQPSIGGCRILTQYVDQRRFRTASAFFPQVTGDLELATAVQNRLFPGRRLTISGVKCAAYYGPLHSIGGDYYDFLSLGSELLAFAISDVSGKGTSAALIMSQLHASLHAYLMQPGIDPEALVTSLNRVLYESTPAHVFASLFYGEYDLQSRILNYVNAGHTPALVVHRQGPHIALVHLESQGIPIGIFPDAAYQSARCRLDPGDLFIAYTDGITETRNTQGEQWGIDRLETVLANCAGSDPEKIVNRILFQREEFARPIAVEDDATLMAVSIDPELNHRVAGPACERRDGRSDPPEAPRKGARTLPHRATRNRFTSALRS
jgi:phosphoserine phosphatase RsbU/P